MEVFLPLVVGALKPSITFCSLGLLLLAPSSLPLAPTLPHSPLHPTGGGDPNTYMAIGSKLEQAGSELGASWSEMGVSWSKGSDLGVRGASFSLLPCCPLAPCPQRWWRSQYIVSCSLDIGSEVQLAGSEGSDSRDLGVRGVICEWGEPASAYSHLAP